jgi:hypothetical protein
MMRPVVCFMFADALGDEEVWQGAVAAVPRVGEHVDFQDGRRAVVQLVEWYPGASGALMAGVFIAIEGKAAVPTATAPGLPDGVVERFATRVALGNNGGDWIKHYTEPQREHWRTFVRDLAAEIAAELPK